MYISLSQVAVVCGYMCGYVCPFFALLDFFLFLHNILVVHYARAWIAHVYTMRTTKINLEQVFTFRPPPPLKMVLPP